MGYRLLTEDAACLGLGAALDYARALSKGAEQRASEAAQAAEHERSTESMKGIT